MFIRGLRLAIEHMLLGGPGYTDAVEISVPNPRGLRRKWDAVDTQREMGGNQPNLPPPNNYLNPYIKENV